MRVNPESEPVAKYVYGEKTAILDVVALSLALESAKKQLAVSTVVLPEPDAWRYSDARGHYRYRGKSAGFAEKYPSLKPQPLYTEQQVRALLATGGQAQAMEVLGWVHKTKRGKIGNHFYTYEPHCDTAVRDDGGEKIAVIAASGAAPHAQADARDARKSGCAESNRYCHARMCLDGDAEHEHDCPAGRAAIAAAKEGAQQGD